MFPLICLIWRLYNSGGIKRHIWSHQHGWESSRWWEMEYICSWMQLIEYQNDVKIMYTKNWLLNHKQLNQYEAWTFIIFWAEIWFFNLYASFCGLFNTLYLYQYWFIIEPNATGLLTFILYITAWNYTSICFEGQTLS